MQKTLTAIATLTLAIAAVPALAADQPMRSSAVTVPIAQQNGSSQTGTATLTPTADGKGTKVDIELKGEPDGATEPAHIHLGTCSKLDPAPKYPLSSIVGGKSASTVDVPLAQLQASPLAINVHQSAAALQTYVACGNIPASTTSAPAPPAMPAGAPSPGY